MPTYYNIITTNEAKKLVDTNDLNGIENYICVETLPDKILIDIEKNKIENNKIGNDHINEEKLYHILCYAVKKGNLIVLQHLKNQINIDYVPDGNAYNILDYAIKKYVTKYICNEDNTNRYDIIILLMEVQRKNCQKNNIRDVSTHLIDFCDQYNNYDLLTLLVTKYSLSIHSIYHYSIAWNYPKVFDKIILDHKNIIDLDWTISAVETAYKFENFDIINHVLEKIKTIDLNTYNKLINLEIMSYYMINDESDLDNLKICDSISEITTSYQFNKVIDKIKWPSMLKKIKFGPHFNQSLDNVVFPDSLEHISFGINNNWSFYDQPINKFKFPKSLKEYINQGPGSDINIDDICFNDELQYLQLGHLFNQSIDNIKWPNSLTKITFGSRFDRSLDQVKFPDSLTVMQFYQSHSSNSINTLKHPIKKLLLLCIKENIEKLPASVEIIQCHSDEDKKKLPKLPPNIQLH